MSDNLNDYLAHGRSLSREMGCASLLLKSTTKSYAIHKSATILKSNSTVHLIASQYINMSMVF